MKRSARDDALAKTTRPRLVAVLPRRRLFRLLEHRQPVLWVSGSPGAGKTTLVSSYLTARRLPHLWYQLDENDTDVATFFYYLGLAAERAAPRVKRRLPVMKPEYRASPSIFARRYFQDLWSRVPRAFVLVLDNYQEVAKHSPFHDVIRAGIEVLPAGHRLIAVSRGEPPPSLARLRAGGGMMVLGRDELRLTSLETKAMTRLRGLKLSAEELKRLQARTQGWAAGITLMLDEPVRASRAPAAVATRTPAVLFDYFGAESFRKAPPAIQEFLLQTAFLPRMTVRMAEEMTGSRSAERILSGLHASNYFTERRGKAEAVYQYHTLFREFLLSRAHDSLSPADITAVERRAAALLARAGQAEHAVGLLHEAEDWDGLVQLLVDHASSLIAQGRNQNFEEWAGYVPETRLADEPWLQYWLGVARAPFGLDRARLLFERAFEIFECADDPAGAYSAWSAAVDALLFEQGDFTRLDPWIARLEPLRERYPEFPSPEIEGRVSASMLAALMFRQPQHREVEVWSERALASSHHGTVDRRMSTGYVLLQYYLWMGWQAKAAVALELLRDLARGQDASPLVEISYRAAEANYHWHLAATAQCLAATATGQDMARESGVHVFDVNLVAQSVYGALVAGDLPGARARLVRMAALAKRGHAFHAAHYHFLSAWESLIRRELPVALEHAGQAMRHSLESGTPFPQAWNHLGLAHILAETGDIATARDHLASAMDLARPLGSRMLQYMVFLADAHIAIRAGDDTALVAVLHGAMKLGREQGFVMARWWQPDVMAACCSRALEAGIKRDYVRTLVRAHGLVPEPPPVEVEAWPWVLVVRSLGTFDLKKDRPPLISDGKAQQKPLALLKVLIAFGGRNVAEERLADTLWPDSAGDTASQALATTLHRLRALIGEERALRMHEHRLSLDPRYVWLDTWAFERLLAEADDTDAAGREPEAINLTARALALYRGPLFGERDENAWALSMRERLRAKFLRATARLGRQWLRAGDLERAAGCYERGLEVDDLAEELYQGLMACYERAGRRSQALVVYDRCRRALASGLDVTPSPATEAIYRRVKRG